MLPVPLQVGEDCKALGVSRSPAPRYIPFFASMAQFQLIIFITLELLLSSIFYNIFCIRAGRPASGGRGEGVHRGALECYVLFNQIGLDVQGYLSLFPGQEATAFKGIVSPGDTEVLPVDRRCRGKTERRLTADRAFDGAGKLRVEGHRFGHPVDRKVARDLRAIAARGLYGLAYERDLRIPAGIEDFPAPEVVITFLDACADAGNVDLRRYGGPGHVGRVELDLSGQLVKHAPNGRYVHMPDGETGH